MPKENIDNIVMLILCVAFYVIAPIGIFLLAWTGKIDLNRWLNRARACPRCGSVRVRRYCGQCGQRQAAEGEGVRNHHFLA